MMMISDSKEFLLMVEIYMKHIATSNNQIAYSNFEINTKMNNNANEIMDIKRDISVIKGLLLGELGNQNESIEGSHKMKHENYDWKLNLIKLIRSNSCYYSIITMH